VHAHLANLVVSDHHGWRKQLLWTENKFRIKNVARHIVNTVLLVFQVVMIPTPFLSFFKYNVSVKNYSSPCRHGEL
jgi:hypothetical protein